MLALGHGALLCFGIIPDCQKVIKLCSLNAEYFYIPLKFSFAGLTWKILTNGMVLSRIVAIGNVCL